MLRIEKKNAESPIEQKPRWIRNQVRTGPGYEDMKSRVAGASLHTVCLIKRLPRQPPRLRRGRWPLRRRGRFCRVGFSPPAVGVKQSKRWAEAHPTGSKSPARTIKPRV